MLRTLDRLPQLRWIARFGAGYDSIDRGACTRAGVAVTNTPDGTRRPVAMAALTLILGLAHRLLNPDVLHTGAWKGKTERARVQ